MTNSADPDQLATDLDLHCLQRQDISGFSRTRVNINPCPTEPGYPAFANSVDSDQLASEEIYNNNLD